MADITDEDGCVHEDGHKPRAPGPADSGPGSWRVVPVEDGVRIEIRPRRDWLHAVGNLAGGAAVAVFGFKLGFGSLPPEGDGPGPIGHRIIQRLYRHR